MVINKKQLEILGCYITSTSKVIIRSKNTKNNHISSKTQEKTINILIWGKFVILEKIGLETEKFVFWKSYNPNHKISENNYPYVCNPKDIYVKK